MQQNHSSINGNDILVAKFNYQAQENHELSIVKNERLVLLDDSCPWWKVKRADSDDIGYIPSNFARREKRSLLDKIISKRIVKKTNIQNGHNSSTPPPPNPLSINTDRILSTAIVKFRYDAQSEDEISLNKGLCVNVLQKKTDGWWFVQNDKERGWFPSNYLIELSTSENSLSLLNNFNQQNHCPPSPVSSHGLSSSSSANSNLVEPTNLQQIRHNSHPLHINQTFDSYNFEMKPTKLAHSDGTLDTCNNYQHDETKNNSCSALIERADLSLNDEIKKLHLKSLPTIDEQWYYGQISRDEAEKHLKLHGSDQGDFLIRDSERRAGHFSLSIRADSETIRHFRIEYSDSEQKYLIGKRSFSSLYDLIEHYKNHPVFEGDQLQKLYLGKPLILNDLNDH